MIFAGSAFDPNFKPSKEASDLVKTLALASALTKLAIGSIFLVLAGVIYFKKLKKVAKKESIWIIAAIICGIIGAIIFIIGLISLFFAFQVISIFDSLMVML